MENLHARHDDKANLLNIHALVVMAGLSPAIHHSSKESSEEEWMRGSSPRMTLRWDPEINYCGKSAVMILFCSNR